MASNTNSNDNKEITVEDYAHKLLQSKNIILRGAPGTGKSYLAKEIAAYVINKSSMDELTEEQKKQIEFVQFHPSYDYTDFVDGLRPIVKDDGTIGFELKDGIFKKFVKIAKENFKNANTNKEILEQEYTLNDLVDNFLIEISEKATVFETSKYKIKFTIQYPLIKEDFIEVIFDPVYKKDRTLLLHKSKIIKIIKNNSTPIFQVQQIKSILDESGDRKHSYYFILCIELQKYIKKHKQLKAHKIFEQEKLKNYVFIIDEINRGEISKIFGELFFSIDPGYRGESGAVSTQYSNLHEDSDDKFYIPDNVYIIGTMNDIDRSVDSFDFAMRRRFRFIEIDANERIEMLDILEDKVKNIAKQKMKDLNEAIVNTEGLNKNYQIGASYFLKLKDLKKEVNDDNKAFEILWTDYLKPLLQEYIHGLYNENEIMDKFQEAYKTLETNNE